MSFDDPGRLNSYATVSTLQNVKLAAINVHFDENRLLFASDQFANRDATYRRPDRGANDLESIPDRISIRFGVCDHLVYGGPRFAGDNRRRGRLQKSQSIIAIIRAD